MSASLMVWTWISSINSSCSSISLSEPRVVELRSVTFVIGAKPSASSDNHFASSIRKLSAAVLVRSKYFCKESRRVNKVKVGWPVDLLDFCRVTDLETSGVEISRALLLDLPLSNFLLLFVGEAVDFSICARTNGGSTPQTGL